MQSDSITEAITILKECGQENLIKKIEEQENQEKKNLMCAQVVALSKVTPTGMTNYCTRGKALLKASKEGANPFDKYKPEVPTGVFLTLDNPKELDEYEASGLKELSKTGFVLIAGGLGERLGYSGIKIDLPVTTITKDYCYLKYYAQYALACRDRVRKEEGLGEDFYVPFCIMVSGDTQAKTIALLEANDYFGLGKDRVDIIKQENVPALMDNEANFAIDEENFTLITKPHGHGDIHNLLFDSGVAKKWLDMGKEWMVFIQDTNALAMKAIPSILGVSRKNNWQMNSVCVPRVPGEAMGAICRLVDESDSTKEIVINVEYNQLEGMLKDKWNPEGDIKNDQGYSHFPGNTNTLVFKLAEYYENLTKTQGVIPEFVNPKYADAEKTQFKAATRLECMMQDYPKLLTSTGEVGFTMYEPWFVFSPAKNNVKDAAACIAKGIPSFGAAEAEYNFFNWTNKVLEYAGVEIERATEKTNGFAFGPKVLLDPQFAITYQDVVSSFKGKNKLGSKATLILRDATSFENLEVNEGTFICEQGTKAPGRAITFVPVEESDPEIYQIRGYKPSNV